MRPVSYVDSQSTLRGWFRQPVECAEAGSPLNAVRASLDELSQHGGALIVGERSRSPPCVR